MSIVLPLHAVPLLELLTDHHSVNPLINPHSKYQTLEATSQTPEATLQTPEATLQTRETCEGSEVPHINGIKVSDVRTSATAVFCIFVVRM